MKLFLIAGEPSGDRLGAALMAGLRSLAPDLVIEGVGGPAMQAEGLNSLFPMEELAVMGLVEILPKYLDLRRRLNQTAEAVLAARPDALVTIDSPGFCLRVARKVRAVRPGQRTIHYVAPSVWAWRPGRAAHMAQVIDHVLAILPFEPPYMTAAGMGCDFVGHPVVAEPVATPAQAQAFRKAHGIAEGDRLIAALPGSRRGEIARMLPLFGTALRQLLPGQPALRVVLPTPGYLAEQVHAATRDWVGRPVILPAPDVATRTAAFAASDAALAASGTVSLELAAQGTPMVIGYRIHPLSEFLINRMLLIDTVTLVNLVSETRTVPEFLGRACTPDALAAALSRLLGDPVARAEQIRAMATTMGRLGRGGEDPGLRAARSVLGAIGR